MHNKCTFKDGKNVGGVKELVWSVSVNKNLSLLPLRFSAVLTPANLIDSTEPELVGSGRREPADGYLGH